MSVRCRATVPTIVRFRAQTSVATAEFQEVRVRLVDGLFKEIRMRTVLLAAVLLLSPLDGLAGERQIGDVKELAGRWRGWVNEVAGDEWSTMNVSPDGSYKASTFSGTIVGKFYLEAGKLRYRSSRTTPLAMPSAAVLGTASVSEDKGKTILTLTPEDPTHLGRAEYERVE
jgi:hypothetical protein